MNEKEFTMTILHEVAEQGLKCGNEIQELYKEQDINYRKIKAGMDTDTYKEIRELGKRNIDLHHEIERLKVEKEIYEKLRVRCLALIEEMSKEDQ